MMARKIASWLSLLSGAWLILWALYMGVVSPIFGDSRGQYAGPEPGPSLTETVFTPEKVMLLVASAFFGALLILAFFGLRRPEASTRQAWAVVALAAAVPAVFWVFFGGAILGIVAGVVGLVEAARAQRPPPTT